MSEASERAGAFFGRRKGKKLRAGQDELVQSLLPAIRAIPGRALPSQFPNRRRGKPGSRSASAAASILLPRPAPTATSTSSAASPS